MNVVAVILTFCAQVIAEHLKIGNDAVCQLDNASDLRLRLERKEIFVYICEAPNNSAGNLCAAQGNHCQQLTCNMQELTVPRVSVIDEQTDEKVYLPRAHIIVATILALGFVVSALGLFIWVRATRRANVCWAKTHAHTSPAHSELSISDDNHLDDKDHFNGAYGGMDKIEKSSPALPVTRDSLTRVEMREQVNSHISRDLRKESIAEVDEER